MNKKILSILMVFILFITGCTSISKDAKIDDVDQPSIVEEINEPQKSVLSEEFYFKYEFANENLFNEHYEKHVLIQKEFGDITKEEYLKSAQDFLNSTSETLLTKEGKEGDTYYFDPATDEYAVVSKWDKIRTYFIPNPEIHGYKTNLAYYESRK